GAAEDVFDLVEVLLPKRPHPDVGRRGGDPVQVQYGVVEPRPRRQAGVVADVVVLVGGVPGELVELLQRDRQRDLLPPLVAHASGPRAAGTGGAIVPWARAGLRLSHPGRDQGRRRGPVAGGRTDMKVGIAGFSGSGKSTVFQWLTGAKPDPAKSQHGQVGVAKVPDDRLTWLAAHFKPKKTTPATLELLDTPGLLPTERKDNPRRLGIMRDAAGLLVVLTGYGGGDTAGELRAFREELLFADLEIVTNRVGRL